MEPEKKLLQCKKCRHGYLEGQLHNCKFQEIYHKPKEFKSDGFEEKYVPPKKVCQHCGDEVIRTFRMPKYTCELCRSQKNKDRNLIHKGIITLAEFNEKWYT